MDEHIRRAIDSARVYRMAQGRYAGKFKDPWTGAWRNKTLPKELWDAQDDDAALRWYQRWVAETLSRGGVGAENGDLAPPPAPTIRSLLDRWRKHREEVGDDKTDVASSISCIERWGAVVNDVPLAELSVPKVAAWVTWLKTKTRLAPLTVRNVVQTFRSLVVDAVGYGWVAVLANPFTDPFIRKVMPDPVPVAGKDVIVALRPEDMRVLARCEAIPEPRRTLNLFAMATGMRESEIAGLAWEHVDLKEGLVRVVRQLRSQKLQTFKPPKKDSKGTVPLHPSAARALVAWKETGWAAWTGRAPNASDPVFPRPDGTFGHVTTARCFREDLVAAGLPPKMTTDEGKLVPFVFHSTRKSFVTALDAAGVPEDDRQVLMRHARKGVTNRHYTAKDLARLRKAVAKLPL